MKKYYIIRDVHGQYEHTEELSDGNNVLHMDDNPWKMSEGMTKEVVDILAVNGQKGLKRLRGYSGCKFRFKKYKP